MRKELSDGKDLVNKNVLSCLLKDGREVDAVTLVGRLFHACATVTRNDRSPMERMELINVCGVRSK